MLLKTMRWLTRSRVQIAFSRSLLDPVQLSVGPPKQFYSTTKDAVDPPHLWIKSPRPDIPLAVGKTIAEVIWEETVKYGKKPAIECFVSGRKYDFEEVFRYSRGFAASLIKMGVPRGTTVSFVLPNIPEFPIAALGCLDAGCIVSASNPMYTEEETERQLITSDATIAITVEVFLPILLNIKKKHPHLKHIIVIGKAPEGCLDFFQLMRQDPAGFEFVKGSEINPAEDTALLPFSSGTTGLPKGVMVTHSNIATNIKQYFSPDCSAVQKLSGPDGTQERTIGLLPFFHCFGFTGIMLAGLHHGIHTMTLPKFQPDTFIGAFRRHRPTVTALVPPLVSFMAQNPEFKREDLESSHSIVCGAAPFGPALINKLLEKAGKFIFCQEGYGMTEMNVSSHLVAPSTKNSKIGSVGTLLPSTIAKVIDPETGKTLERGERGELCIKGPQVMKGYFKNEQATKETIDSDGWLHTGDIAYCDDTGHLYIVDRLKELIKVKGLQVAPSELENVLRTNPGVADVAVIGVSDEKCGEVPRAYIVKKGDQLNDSSVHEFLKEKLAKHKQLQGGIEFIDAIPRAPSGKILRRELVADYKAKNKSA